METLTVYDLKVSNLINFSGEYSIVEMIDSGPKCIYIRPIGSKKTYHSLNPEGDPKIKPVPLSGVGLVKAGFSINGIDGDFVLISAYPPYSENDYSVAVSQQDESECWELYIRTNKGTINIYNCKYVHELQNAMQQLGISQDIINKLNNKHYETIS